MTGFATVPDAVRAAGRTVGDAANALRGADCGAPVADLSAALPGSASANVAEDYARAWSDTFKRWCDQADQHASKLTDAAAGYQATEDSNTAGVTKLRGPR